MHKELHFDLKTKPSVSGIISDIGEFSLCPEDNNVLATLFESAIRKSLVSYITVDIFANAKNQTINQDEIIRENEKILSKGEFMDEIINLKKETDVSWIDTEIVGFDWEKINSFSNEELISKLKEVSFKKADVATYDKKKGTQYITYKIKD